MIKSVACHDEDLQREIVINPGHSNNYATMLDAFSHENTAAAAVAILNADGRVMQVGHRQGFLSSFLCSFIFLISAASPQ